MVKQIALLLVSELIDRVSKIGYELLSAKPTDPNIGNIWPHYRGLDHLMFGSPQLTKDPAIRSKTIENVDFSVIKSRELVEKYFTHLNRCCEEHLNYIDHTSSIKF